MMPAETLSGQFYANIIDSVGDGVMALDPAGRIILMNPAAEELSGLSHRMAEGVAFSDIFRGEALLLELVAKATATGMSVSDHENILLRRSGHPSPVSVTVSPLLDRSGANLGMIVVLRDLTSIRELEEAVRHADRLSGIGTLAAGLAHEIKNPLGGIKGAAQLMGQEIDPGSDLHDYLRVMLKETERVNHIVEELLHLATPRKLRLEAVNPHKVLDDIILLQKEVARSKHIALRTDFDPSIPPILADEELLTQLFLNLIKNALEAVGSNGEVRVTSRVVAEYRMNQKGEGRSRMVSIEVRDTGPGIGREQLEQLFTPFFTTKSGGTGLGLAICQKIVAEHRGMIKVDSEPGCGTAFAVLLPLVQ
jgi:two-component system nitrogen regulation sensor histidine kinase GlnL